MQTRLALIAVLATIVGTAHTALAVTYDVNDSTTLTNLLGSQSQIGTVADGDRIHIHGQPGRPYIAPPGGWFIRKSLEILGDGMGEHSANGDTSTILKAPGSDPVFVIDATLLSTDEVLENVHIHDLQITHAGAPSSSPTSNGIRYDSSNSTWLSQLRIERVWVHGMGGDGIHLVAPSGKYGITGASLINCVSGDNLGDGLKIKSSSMFYVLGGEYSNNGLNGMEVRECLAARIIGPGFENNLRTTGGLAELFLESSHGFMVDGGHFENFDKLPRDTYRGIHVSGCGGGRVSNCSFADSAVVTGSTGINIGFGTTSSVLVGPNWFSNVDVAVNVVDDPTITGCTILPQSIGVGSSGGKIVVPETVDRGHMVFATSTTTSNVTAGVAFPRLSTTKRDNMTAAASGGTRREGLIIYNDASKDFNLFDGSRWREGVAFFPVTSAVNAPSGGVNLPNITSTQRDNMPAAFKLEGTIIYNVSSHRFEGWNGSAWKAITP